MTAWNSERTNVLIQMAGDGAKANDIAAALGMSRNAVLGRAFRIGVSIGNRTPRKPMKVTRGVWPPDAIAYLRQGCEDKKSSYEIAAGLAEIHGINVSANYVRSRASKMGLRVGGGPGAHMARGRLLGAEANVKKAEAKKAAREAAIAAIECVRVSFDDLTRRSCRFPLGDPRDDGFAYCGSDNGGDSSYCAGHRALCYKVGGR